MHTAQHLLHHCLMGKLARDRTIILVTHHVGLCLPAATYFVELSRGTVLRQGPIQDFEDLWKLEDVVEGGEDIPSTHSDQIAENEVDALEIGPKPAQKKKKKILIEDEARAVGQVSFGIYLTYIRAAGLLSWILTFAVLVVSHFVEIVNQVYHFYFDVSMISNTDTLLSDFPRDVG
jgi:hypothetical protein